MKAVIIEDEEVMAESLRDLIRETEPNIHILAVLQSIEESVEWFQLNPMPDLVFLDIHLADGSSFNIFKEITITCPIIFTTAYDEYALKAFEVNSLDYLLKPIDKPELLRALTKYKNLTGDLVFDKEAFHDIMKSMKQSLTVYKSFFLVSERDKLIPLDVNDIAFITLENRWGKACTYTNKTYSLNESLDVLITRLNPNSFFRANRQYIIAHKAIKDISNWFGNKLSVNLKIPVEERILISRSRVKEFKNWFMGEG